MSSQDRDSPPSSWHNPAMVGGSDILLDCDVEIEAILIFPRSEIKPGLEAPEHSDKNQYKKLGGVLSQTQPIRRHWAERLTQEQKEALQAVPDLSTQQEAQYLRRWPDYHGGAFVTDLTPETYADSENHVLRPIQNRISALGDLPWVKRAITAYGNHSLQVVADICASSGTLVPWVFDHRGTDVDLQIWLHHKTGQRPDYNDYIQPGNEHRYTLLFSDTVQALPSVEVLRWAERKKSLARLLENMGTTKASQRSESARALGYKESNPPSFVNYLSHGFELASPIFDVDNLPSAQELTMYLRVLKGTNKSYYNAVVNESCGLHVHIRGTEPDFPQEPHPGAGKPPRNYAGMRKEIIATLVLFLTLYEEQLDTLFPEARRVTPLENRLEATGLWSVRDWAVMECAGNRHAEGVPDDELSLDSGDMAAAIQYAKEEGSEEPFRLRYKPLQAIIDDIYSWNGDQLMTMPTRRLDDKKKFAPDRKDPKLYKWGPKDARKDHPLTFWYDDNKRTLEFRQHEGCLDGHHVHHWVQFCAAIVRTASKAAESLNHKGEMIIPGKEGSGMVTEYADGPLAEAAKERREAVLHQLGHHSEDWHDGMSIYDLFDACGLDQTNEIRQHFESRAAFYAVPPADETDEFEPLAFGDKGRYAAMPEPKFKKPPMATWTSRPSTWYTRAPAHEPTCGESAEPPIYETPSTYGLSSTQNTPEKPSETPSGNGSSPAVAAAPVNEPARHTSPMALHQLQRDRDAKEAAAKQATNAYQALMDKVERQKLPQDSADGTPAYKRQRVGKEPDVSPMQDIPDDDRPGRMSAAERERDRRIREHGADIRSYHDPRRSPGSRRHGAGSEAGQSASLQNPSRYDPERLSETRAAVGTPDNPEPLDPVERLKHDRKRRHPDDFSEEDDELMGSRRSSAHRHDFGSEVRRSRYSVGGLPGIPQSARRETDSIADSVLQREAPGIFSQGPAQISTNTSLQDLLREVSSWREAGEPGAKSALDYSTTQYEQPQSEGKKIADILEQAERVARESRRFVHAAGPQLSSEDGPRNSPESATRPGRVIVRDGGQASGSSGVIVIPSTILHGDEDAATSTNSPHARERSEAVYPPTSRRDSQCSDQSVDPLFDDRRDGISPPDPVTPVIKPTFLQHSPVGTVVTPRSILSSHPRDKSASTPSLSSSRPQTQTTYPKSPDYITTPRGTRRARFAVPEVSPTSQVPIRTRSGSRVVRWVLPQIAPGVPVHFVPPEVFDSIANALTDPRTGGDRKYSTGTGAERTKVWGRQRGQFNSEGGGRNATFVNEDDLNSLRRDWERRRREAGNSLLYYGEDEDETSSDDDRDGDYDDDDAEGPRREREESPFRLPVPESRASFPEGFTVLEGDSQPLKALEVSAEHDTPTFSTDSEAQQANHTRQQGRVRSPSIPNPKPAKTNWRSPHYRAPSENIIPRDGGPIIIRSVEADDIGLHLRLLTQRFLGELQDRGMDVYEAGLRESNRLYDQQEAKRKRDLVVTKGRMQYVLQDEQATQRTRESVGRVMRDVDGVVKNAVEGFTFPGLSVNDDGGDDNLQTPLSGNKFTDAEADDEDSEQGYKSYGMRWRLSTTQSGRRDHVGSVQRSSETHGKDSTSSLSRPAGSIRWPSEIHGQYDDAESSSSSSSSSGSSTSSSSSGKDDVKPKLDQESKKVSPPKPFRAGEQRYRLQDRGRVSKDRRPPKSRKTTRHASDPRVGQLSSTLIQVLRPLSTFSDVEEESDTDSQNTESSQARQPSPGELRAKEESRRRAVNKLKRAQRALKQASTPRRRKARSPPRRLPDGFSPNNPSRLRISTRAGDIDDNQPLRTLDSASPDKTLFADYTGRRANFEDIYRIPDVSAPRLRTDRQQDLNSLESAGSSPTLVDSNEDAPPPRRRLSLADMLRRVGNGIQTIFGSSSTASARSEVAEDRLTTSGVSEESEQDQELERERSTSYDPSEPTSQSSEDYSQDDNDDDDDDESAGYREVESGVNPGYGLWFDGSTEISDEEISTYPDGQDEDECAGYGVGQTWQTPLDSHKTEHRYRPGAPTPESDGEGRQYKRASTRVSVIEPEGKISVESQEDEEMKRW